MRTKKNLVVYTKLLGLILGVILFAEVRAEDYNIVERFKLNEDRVKTYEMMNSMGHDFIFGFTGLLGDDFPDFVDDAQDAADENTQAAADAFFDKYQNTEQNLRVNFNIGAPLPSFSLFKAKVRPSLRINGNLGTSIAVREGEPQINDILASITGIPQALRDAIASCDFSGIGDNVDIVVYARDTASCITNAQATVIGINKYFTGSSLSSTLFLYAKAEARAGLNFDFVKGRHWFGNFSIYGLGRADYTQTITSQAFVGDAEVAEFPDEMNTTINMVTDFRLGYRNKNLRGWAAIEEIKIANIGNNEEEGGELIYGNDPLFRLHGEYLYRFHGFSVKPFVGVHKRKGYDFADGAYAGTDLGLHFWGNRLGVRARGMVDKEHITISPQLKLWLMHLDYMLKVPVSSDVDGVKPATIHSLNLRFFI